MKSKKCVEVEKTNVTYIPDSCKKRDHEQIFLSLFVVFIVFGKIFVETCAFY